MTEERSISQLVGDLTDQTKRLVRAEARLAARELTEKARRGARGIGALSAAGVLAGYGGFALVICVILALSKVLDGWIAALVTGGALLVCAGVAALIGRAQLRRAMPPVPEATIERVREDIAVVTEREEQT